jgi:sec-independent protein translocase protein TatA
MLAAFLGGWEWVVVLVAVLMLFGAKRIPELAKGLGQGIREFKKATREVTDEIHNAAEDTPPPPQHKLPSNGGQSQPDPTVSQPSTAPKS